MRPNKRLRDAALLLPFAGLLLFLPPYVRIFDQSEKLFGIPLLHLYIFAVWFIGILLTAWVSHWLGKPAKPPRTRREPEA